MSVIVVQILLRKKIMYHDRKTTALSSFPVFLSVIMLMPRLASQKCGYLKPLVSSMLETRPSLIYGFSASNEANETMRSESPRKEASSINTNSLELVV